jgi:hypothetical protein
MSKPFATYLDAETSIHLEALSRRFDRRACLRVLWRARNAAGPEPASDADAEALLKLEMRRFALATSADEVFRAEVAEASDLSRRAETVAGKLSLMAAFQADPLELSVLIASEGAQLWSLEFETAWIGSSPPEALARELDRRATIHGDNARSAINAYLQTIYDDPSYQAWLEIDQFAGEADPRGRYVVPAQIGVNHREANRLLTQCGLIAPDRTLEAKVDRHYDRIHLTDGFWTSPSMRVYPTTDESEHICAYVKSKGYDQRYKVLIDPACGSGHHAMGLSSFSTRASYDINLRAIAYARANALLAGDTDQDFGVRDIRTGLPVLARRLSGPILIAANMPFALLPSAEVDKGKVAQDGGARGVTLTNALLHAIRALWSDTPEITQLRSVILFYSLGRSVEGPWEIAEEARTLLPDAQIKTSILTDQQMWRVNGRKSEANPMPIDRLHTKAKCRFTWPEYEEHTVTEGYRQRERELAAESWTHLGYGILDIDLSR